MNLIETKSSHIEKKSSYIDPRLAYSKKSNIKKELLTVNSNNGNMNGRVRVVDSYVFDETSTASDLLRGRDLSGSYAIVTGANRGVGLEISKALAYAGCTVILGCRNLKTSQAACDSLLRDRVIEKDLRNSSVYRDVISYINNHFRILYINIFLVYVNVISQTCVRYSYDVFPKFIYII